MVGVDGADCALLGVTLIVLPESSLSLVAEGRKAPPRRAVGSLLGRQITVQWTGNSRRNRFFPEEVSRKVSETNRKSASRSVCFRKCLSAWLYIIGMLFCIWQYNCTQHSTVLVPTRLVGVRHAFVRAWQYGK